MGQSHWPNWWGRGCSAPRCLAVSPISVSVPWQQPKNQQRWAHPRVVLPSSLWQRCGLASTSTGLASSPPSPASSLPGPTRVCSEAGVSDLPCSKVRVAFPQVVLLVYHWSSRESERHLLVHKAVARWTAEEVVLWLEQLGPWASLYRDRFLSERVNGRWGAKSAAASLTCVFEILSTYPETHPFEVYNPWFLIYLQICAAMATVWL